MDELQNGFHEIVDLIEQARNNALQAVNKELVMLYWHVGKALSENIAAQKWGSKTIDQLADFIKAENPQIKGFSRRGLYRMKQFYETYQDYETEIVPTLLAQIPWSNHIAIMEKSKSHEERLFYLKLCAENRYTAREMTRQINSGYYERYMLSTKKPQPAIAAASSAQPAFLDNYVLEFLDLPETVSEHDLKKAIIKNLKNFVLEIGKDFTFIDEEYRLIVGGQDYFIDLLFYHRGLCCLVAIELKISDFQPEFLGKMDFYLEALDRQVKKPNENPSVGIILCAKKNDEIVEYALSRTLSPTMVSDYTLKLIDKELLRKKLREFMELSEGDTDTEPEA